MHPLNGTMAWHSTFWAAVAPRLLVAFSSPLLTYVNYQCTFYRPFNAVIYSPSLFFSILAHLCRYGVVHTTGSICPHAGKCIEVGKECGGYPQSRRSARGVKQSLPCVTLAATDHTALTTV